MYCGGCPGGAVVVDYIFDSMYKRTKKQIRVYVGIMCICNVEVAISVFRRGFCDSWQLYSTYGRIKLLYALIWAV